MDSGRSIFDMNQLFWRINKHNFETFGFYLHRETIIDTVIVIIILICIFLYISLNFDSDLRIFSVDQSGGKQTWYKTPILLIKDWC